MVTREQIEAEAAFIQGLIQESKGEKAIDAPRSPPGSPDNPVMIGDGVYVTVERGMIRLATRREEFWHFIYFEPEVLHSFYEWCRHSVIINMTDSGGMFELQKT